jgi:hypothetical protein
MIESIVVDARPESTGRRRPKAGRSRAALVRNLATTARAALEAIGLVSVLVVMFVALAPGLREPMARISTGIAQAFGDRVTEDALVEDAAEEDSDGPRIGRQVTLEPAEANVASYLARRYHVADEAVRVMVATAHAAGKEQQIDPLLILAVVAVESSMYPFAQSPVGATGLMQVMPGVHGGKFVERNGTLAALDPVANIQVGSQILSDVIRRGGSIERGLQLYVGAGNLADDGGYASRVLGEFGRLKLAAGGGVAAALAAGLRSDTRSGTDGSETPLTSAVPPELSIPLARKQPPA